MSRFWMRLQPQRRFQVVFVGGGYVGPLAKAKRFPLRPGNHDVELRGLNGRTLYDQRVQVIPGQTTEIHTNPAG
jgi:hypothetical protein